MKKPMKKSTRLTVGISVIAVCVLVIFVIFKDAVSDSMSENFKGISSQANRAISPIGEFGYSSGNGAMADNMTAEMAAASSGGSESVTLITDRKLIKRVDMSVETKEFDQFMEELEMRIPEFGGYVENMDINNGSAYSSYRSSKDASITIRIPQEQLQAFVDVVGERANVTKHSENIQDVTLEYVDLESHKKVLLTEQESLLKILETATNLEDIIILEERLTRVRYQIESMEAQLRTFDNKVNYSTVQLRVSEVKELTPVEERTIFQQMGDKFIESLGEICNGFIELIIWFVGSIPYFAVLILFILILIGFIKLLNKSSQKSKKSGGEKAEEAVSEKVEEKVTEKANSEIVSRNENE